MAFDPRTFSFMVITDTCSVWNILSARKIFQAANEAKVTFFITPMVLYECLDKPRKTTTAEATELISRLGTLRAQGKFDIQPCDIDDLLEVSRRAPAALSSGELSCIATAFKTLSFAFMTDERKARQYAEQSLHLKVETTPKLYGWLHFHRHLLDEDHRSIISEHEIYERRPLTAFFQIAYETALQYRLMNR